jgi:F-type H+-transporting ATPase subunit b
VLYATVTALAAEAEATAEVVNPILPVENELFYGGLFFIILWALMKWVFLPPVQRTMAARADKIREDLAAADEAKTLATGEAAAYEQALAAARAEAVQIIEAGRTEGELERRRIVGEAETTAGALRAAAAAEITAAKQAALAELRSGLGEVAVSAASAVVDRPLDPAAQQTLVQQYLDQAASAN